MQMMDLNLFNGMSVAGYLLFNLINSSIADILNH